MILPAKISRRGFQHRCRRTRPRRFPAQGRYFLQANEQTPLQSRGRPGRRPGAESGWSGRSWAGLRNKMRKRKAVRVLAGNNCNQAELIRAWSDQSALERSKRLKAAIKQP